MTIADTEWMDKGLCSSEPEVRKLFLLPYLEQFNEKEFYADRLGSTTRMTKADQRKEKEALREELEEERTKHQLGYSIYTNMARKYCESCPVLQQCRASTLSKEEQGEPVFGVAGGYTKEEREELLNPDIAC